MADCRDRYSGSESHANVGRWSIVFAGLMLLATTIGSAEGQQLSAQEIGRLLSLKPHEQSARADRQADEQLLGKLERLRRDDPDWPMLEFLRAELLLQMQRPQPAAEGYRAVVEYAASNPYQDTWGGTGVAGFALYRWLKLQTGSGAADHGAFEKVSAAADSLLQTRLVRSAFRPYAILSSMPLFEEQLYHTLATEAMRVGQRKQAGTYFLNYLARLRSPERSPESDPLYQLVLEQGISTPDRIALLRGKRLVSLGELTAALPQLEAAARSKHEQTRLEALYLRTRALGRLGRISRGEASAMYAEVNRYAANDELSQNALLYDGLQFAADDPEHRRILSRIVDEHPDGTSTDEALYWLARSARLAGDLAQARGWYERLRKFGEETNRLGAVAIDVALAHMWRAREGDLDAAERVLQAFVEDQPNSNDRPRALFLLARIAEERGDAAQAKRRFEETATADWFGYYGLRARMHLADGRAARSHLLVENRKLAEEIRSAYAKSGPDWATIKGAGVYHRRLQSALDNGLYKLALAGENALRQQNPSRRLQDFNFEELDALGLVAPIAAMIALRQDALAAADAEPSLAGRLALAHRLGKTVGDWPVLLSLVHTASIRSAAKRSELMRTPGYLATAYPVIFEETVRKAVAEHRTPPAILYAIMRQESFFYPAALSSAGALGLFQFTARTFAEVDREWQLLERSGAADRAAFLMDEGRSIALGARWFAEKKLPAFGENVLFAALAHHSGDGRVSRWQRIWRERGWLDDTEMIVESFRMHDFAPERSESWGVEARNFARRVIADVAIVDAIGLYRSRSQ